MTLTIVFIKILHITKKDNMLSEKIFSFVFVIKPGAV